MSTKSRRKARETALRTLYEMEIGHVPMEQALQENLKESGLEGDLAEFASEVVRAIHTHSKEIDSMLARIITDWDFSRVAAVDRNILRVAAHELYHCPDIPPAVTINEAVEIGKKYSTAESGRFINGVLAKVLSESPKATWTPVSEAVEEPAEPEAPAEIEEVTLMADSDEAKRLARVGGWQLKSEEEQS